jgi:hypothetical protein
MIERLTRFFGRRRRVRNAPAPAAPSSPVAGSLLAWESELRAIASEASAWTVETGGDLFGRWEGTTTLFLATKAGPNAQRNQAHFRLDVDYLRKLSEPLASQWALRYFGDWHSHHRLGLSAPSSGDRRRIQQVAGRNQFPSMAEIIVTTEGSTQEPIVRIHPWLYEFVADRTEPLALGVKVLPGISPVRDALLARSELPEQELRVWETVPLSRVRIGDDQEPPSLQAQLDVDTTTRDRTLSHLSEALEQASGSAVEQHSTAFGYIIVAKLQEPHHLAFAIDGKWPLSVLEVHRLNRKAGTTEPVPARDGLTALNLADIVEVFRTIKSSEGIA